MKLLCSIYRSPRKPEMYLYVDKLKGLTPVPEGLLTAFGPPALAFEFVLTPERKLAREDVAKVLENIAKQGYHLQMPPPELERDDYLEHLPEELLRLNDPL